MATLIPADGRPPYEVTPSADGVFTLQELQTYVGGYLEALRSPDGRTAYLNEDGKRLQLPVNHRATLYLHLQLPPEDVIVGDVILCTLAETGDESSCTEYWPDANGECQHCDEWIDMHSDAAITAGEARAARERGER